MIKHYILEGQKVIPCDLMTWARWFEKSDRIVVVDEIGDNRVSTVFLGLDHSYGEGPPLLFETMVFPTDSYTDKFCERYSTYTQAIEGHQQIVEKLKAGTLEMY